MDVAGVSMRPSTELVLYCRRVAGAIGRVVPGDLRLRDGAGTDGPAAERWPTTSAWRCSSRTSCATCARTPRTGASTCPRRTCAASAWSASRDAAAAPRWLGARRGRAVARRGRRGPSAVGARALRGRARASSGSSAALRARAAAGPAQRGLPAGDGGHLPRLLDAHRGPPRAGAAPADVAACPREGLGGGAQHARRERLSAMSAGVRWSLVIGGGLAGITAALDCADGGRAVTLVEVRRRLGGAAYSFEREGLRMDNGQHVFLRCCTAYRGAARAPGQPSTGADPAAPGDPGPEPGASARRVLRRGGLPAPLHLAGALARYRHLRSRKRARRGAGGACARRAWIPATRRSTRDLRRLARPTTARARGGRARCGI